MSIQVDGIDQWREYFRTGNADIFEIIERGIVVAASDCPTEFKLRRDRIAEVLFSTRSASCTDCDRVGLSVPELVESGSGGAASVAFDVAVGSKESMDDQTNPMSNCSYGIAEALTDELEEEALVFQDVLGINEVLTNFQDESETVLFESLRRLQLMRLTISVLKATSIGKTVNGLRRHEAKQVRQLARDLIGEWKTTVDEYMETMQEGRDPAGAGEATPDSINPSAVVDEEEEEGLPFPPMDDCVFFTTQNINFAEFFDGIDEDGNPQTSGELNNKKESGRRPPVVKPTLALRKELPPKAKVVLSKDDKPLNPASGPGRPVKPNGEQRVNPPQKLQDKLDKPNIPRRPLIQSEKLRSSGEEPTQEKMEATKRRLQESYQEAANAKRQRTIQVMELHDLPKQGLGPKKSNSKVGNPTRKGADARR